MKAVAIAHPNIALAKYWGKRESTLNLPDVGSVSITLDSLWSKTQVAFDADLAADDVLLNGEQDEKITAKISAFIDLFRQRKGVNWGVKVFSDNNFPTAAGLASSASGYAALAVAADKALGLNLTKAELSSLARQGSGSAARSVFGGFVRLHKGASNDGEDCYAEELMARDNWPLTTIIAITSTDKKTIGSTAGMTISKETSPYYQDWVDSSPADIESAVAAIKAQDFEQLAAISEHSCLKMHALMMSSRPALMYWNHVTYACIESVYLLRKQGVPVFFTIDAGPQLKAICLPEYAEKVKSTLADIAGVKNILQCGLGYGARIVDE